MLDRQVGFHAEVALQHRRAFCLKNGIEYDETVYQAIRYADDATYDTVRLVGRHHTTREMDGMSADALITTESGVGLFLPVADCVATVVYDPVERVLALLHLGRHSTLSDLIPNVISQFCQLGSVAENLLVWMSPHAQRASYRLAWFDRADEPEWRPYVDRVASGYHVDLAGFNTARFESYGVRAEHIAISTVNTMRDEKYFSHADGDRGGRMALLAYMR